MSDNASQHFAAVHELKVGMFIHLKGGWLAHPFPLSNFKISSPQQIATIRSLGLKTVRWSPDKSDLEATAIPSERASADLAAAKAGIDANPDARPAATTNRAAATHDVALCAQSAPAATHAGADSAGSGRIASGATASIATLSTPASFAATSGTTGTRATAAQGGSRPVDTDLTSAESRHRSAVAAQRAALQHCQRQFAEANLAYKAMTELVAAKPKLAREQSEALSRALVDKMLAADEVCIRLLTESAGDKAAAHAINVAVISLLLGKSFGLAEAEMLDLGVGAMLHDVGKLDLPERLRNREDHFSPSETLYYQEHVAHGVAQARRMGLAEGAQWVIEQHHEHADGSGFPLRMTSERMSVAARIVALVNRFDNLCNPHVPSRALTPHEALSLLFAQGKSKFDATIMGAFVKMMGVYPPGSAVQLTDDRFALVVAVNSNRPLKPRVLVHEPGISAADALLLDLEREPNLGIRRSLKPLALPRDALEYLAPRPRVAYFFEPALEVEAEAIG